MLNNTIHQDDVACEKCDTHQHCMALAAEATAAVESTTTLNLQGASCTQQAQQAQQASIDAVIRHSVSQASQG
jgi:hypothetical protein